MCLCVCAFVAHLQLSNEHNTTLFVPQAKESFVSKRVDKNIYLPQCIRIEWVRNTHTHTHMHAGNIQSALKATPFRTKSKLEWSDLLWIAFVSPTVLTSATYTQRCPYYSECKVSAQMNNNNGDCRLTCNAGNNTVAAEIVQRSTFWGKALLGNEPMPVKRLICLIRFWVTKV